MRWFKSKAKKKAEDEAAFRARLAKKLENYQSNGPTATFSSFEVAAVDPYDDIHGDGIDADPRWLPSREAYDVTEVALTDLSNADLMAVGRLREAYESNLRNQEILNDPDTQKFDALIRGEEDDNLNSE
jgi:hypothetical protein